MIYGAIDVAMTQLLVDTLMVIFIALALFKLPKVALPKYRIRWRWDCHRAGLGVTLGMLGVLDTSIDQSLADFTAPTACQGLWSKRRQRHPGGFPSIRYPG